MKFTKTTRMSRCFFLFCHPCRNSGRADGFTRSAVGPVSARRRPGKLVFSPRVPEKGRRGSRRENIKPFTKFECLGFTSLRLDVSHVQ